MTVPTPDDILAALDPEQRAVAQSSSGPMVVLAGAGTGKTRAITHRMAYAVSTGVHQPQRVLALTFTARAAGEMRTRLRGLGVTGVQARTFHSAALRQLSYFWPRVYGTELPEVIGNSFGLVAEAARPLGVELSTPLLRDLVGERAELDRALLHRRSPRGRGRVLLVAVVHPALPERVRGGSCR